MVFTFINSTGLTIVAELDLRCCEFVSEKVVITNWKFPLASGVGYWKFVSFDIFELHSDNFLGSMRCGYAEG